MRKDEKALAVRIVQQIKSRADRDNVINNDWQALRRDEADYLTAAVVAVRYGAIAGAALLEGLRTENGEPVEEALARTVLPAALRTVFAAVSRYCTAVQERQYQTVGLGLKAVKPELDLSRIDRLLRKLVGYDSFDEASWMLDEPIINFAQNIVDDFVRVNAAALAAAGLFPTVRRVADSEGCTFCASLAGTYAWPIPDEAFKRHDRCRCAVLLDLEKHEQPSKAVRMLYSEARHRATKARIKRIQGLTKRV